MKNSALRFAKSLVARMLVVLLAAPMAQAGSPQGEQGPAQQAAQSLASIPDAPVPQLSDQATQSSATQSSTPQSGQPNNNPVGTAAAPVAKPTGVAASRPAGAAIAPSKQRRAKSIMIRVGIIVGAGVAVGTVAALSRGSSSRP